jgi:hypothetical protein
VREHRDSIPEGAGPAGQPSHIFTVDVLALRHPLQWDGDDGGTMAKDETKRSAEARACARYKINPQCAFNDLPPKLTRAYGQPAGDAAEILYPATTKPDPAAVMAALEELESKLSNAFEEAKADPTNAMRDFCVVALPAVANFLEKSDVKNEIVRKFFELATFIDEGSLPFLRPPKASGRTYDSLTLWIPRGYVVVGLECILRSGKMKKQEAAKYIAKKYPVFNTLKRNSSHSLAKSIISWRRYYNEGRGNERQREQMAKRYEPRPPDEMFKYAETVLQKTAELVAQAAF